MALYYGHHHGEHQHLQSGVLAGDGEEAQDDADETQRVGVVVLHLGLATAAAGWGDTVTPTAPASTVENTAAYTAQKTNQPRWTAHNIHIRQYRLNHASVRSVQLCTGSNFAPQSHCDNMPAARQDDGSQSSPSLHGLSDLMQWQ